MTWESYEDFVHEVTQVIGWSQRFMFVTRDKALQEQAVGRLRELHSKIREAKDKAISEQLEEMANLMLLHEYLTHSFIEFGNMWIHIKNDEMNQAWDSLVNAQMAIRHALLVRNDSELEKQNERLHQIEAIMFPPQQFTSAGFTIENAECSICGTEYGECGHLKGRVYMGKLCGRNITKCTFTEVSFVDDPADKHCRTLSFRKGDHAYDFMTLREITDYDESSKALQDSQ